LRPGQSFKNTDGHLITVYVYNRLLEVISHCKERNYISLYCVKYSSHW